MSSERPHREARRDAPRPLTIGDYRALARFRYALRVFLRFSENAARAAGTTPAQHQLLLAVKGWSGAAAPSVGELAELLQLRHHSTVELVQRAETVGLVTTRVDPHDQRRHLIWLSSKGERLLMELSHLHRDELRRFRSEMNDVLSELE